jgi:hypothetical protein
LKQAVGSGGRGVFVIAGVVVGSVVGGRLCTAPDEAE